MPWSKASKLDAKLQRQFREAQRTRPAREAGNDEPRVALDVKRWAAVPIRPSSDVVGTVHEGDLAAALARRRAAIYREWRRRADPV